MECPVSPRQRWISHLPRPDQQIRLIQSPDKLPSKDVKIELKVNIFELSEKPKYHALSYTWGPAIHESAQARLRAEEFVHLERPASDLGIFCNGQEVHITQCLLEGLEHIVQRYPGIKLWVDALCIDQDNAIEKNQQIGLMGDIYNQAYQVIVWLGFEIVSTSYLARLYQDYCETPRDLWRRSFYQKSSRSSQAADRPSEKRFQGTVFAPGVGKDLINRNWFLRKWTFQECVLARSITLLCGRYEFDFEVLVDMVDLFPESTELSTRDSGSIDSLLREMSWNLKAIAHSREALAAEFPEVTRGFLDDNYGGHGFEQILLVFLLMTADRRASKRCDEFRSLFGLCDLQARRLGSSTTTMSDYLRLEADSNDYLTQISRLIINNYPMLTPLFFAGWRESCPEQPSWVIDPQLVRTRPMLDCLGKYCAGTSSQFKMQKSAQFKEESFAGISTITRQALYVKGLKLGPTFSTTILQAGAGKVITADAQHDRIDLKKQIDAPAPHDTLLHLTGGAKATEFRLGDESWILLGGEMPFVLRPIKDCFLLIGPAYVDGVMHGEFVQGQGQDLTWREIKIV